MSKPKIAFFGGDPLGTTALETLCANNIVPELVVCSPDRPSGRGLKLAEPSVKVAAKAHAIEVWQPVSYKEQATRDKLEASTWDLFIVVAYNFILPKWLLDLPKKGCLNVHPSLLPALRGPSPIRTAILKNEPESVGITIMLLDEKMDTGPILEQEIYQPVDWPTRGPILDKALAEIGGNLLTEVIPAWLEDKIEPQEQDHAVATYTKKFFKGENELHLNPLSLPTDNEAKRALCLIRAWEGIGDAFFTHKDKRIKIKAAGLSAGGSLELYSVIPEGKGEVTFDTYLRSLAAS